MKNQTFKLLAFSFVLALCFNLSFSNQSRADACLPSCATNDSRMLTFGGQNLNTFVFELLTFGVGSPAGDANLHIRIFDGESGGLWDNEAIGTLEYTLFADPLGNTTGTFPLGTWTGDGSAGLNTGNPMPDNDFFDIIIPNAPEAMAESGNFLYRMAARNLAPDQAVISNFKVQVVGDGTSLFIFPGDQPFGYEATWRGATGPDTTAAGDIIYPTFAVDPVGCDPTPGCYNDPACCFFSPYDGSFDFFFLNDQDRTFLDFWDGDLDYGVTLASDPPPYQDTNDPNTPPGIPIFADVPNTNPQSSAGALPPDDTLPLDEFNAFIRPPNITYSLIDPNGVPYTNVNPSANQEWELFQLNTEPGCAPLICDIEVADIPQGIWHIRVTGMDMWNINYIRAFDKIIGVDPGGNPVPPLSPNLPPVGPKVVPTFSEWGMLAVALFLGVIGIYSLRKKKSADTTSC